VNVEIRRRNGYFGRRVPLDVLANGKRVGSLRNRSVISIEVPDHGAAMQVRMEGGAFSPVLRLEPRSGAVQLECGNPLWVQLDVLNLCYLPWLRTRVFYLREVPSSTERVHVA
jgi:hypothetical protein